MKCTWKLKWESTQQHMENWWNREGFVISHWGTGFPGSESFHSIPVPPVPENSLQRHTDPVWITESERYRLSSNWLGADFLPIAFPDYGTVTLATFLGTEPSYQEDRIIYQKTDISPENDRTLLFDPGNKYWLIMEEICKALAVDSSDRYLVGLPAIAPGFDVLAELRGTENLLMDLILHPEWVKLKLAEITQAFSKYYDRFYDILKGEDGTSVNCWFMLASRGRVSLAQCDFCAMISPEMFAEFVIPDLREQCGYTDRILFHLDGPNAIDKLDMLLEVEDLDAIEFTPGPKVSQGGDPSWYDMYRKIKDSGKAVQVVEMLPDQVVPLFDAIGPEGVYAMVNFESIAQVEKLVHELQQYR